MVKDGPATQARIDEELAPFLDDARPFAGDLVERGWLASWDDGYRLTTAGREAYERLLHAVQANRARITDGLSEEQYRTTVDVLERMCANLVLPCATSSSPPTRSGSASS